MPEPDYQERTLNALDASTRVTTQVLGALTELCGKLDSFKTVVGQEMHGLQEEMGTLNANLDNLSRDFATTNLLLRTDAEERKADDARRAEAEEKEKEWKRRMEEKEKEWAKEIEKLKLTQQFSKEEDNRSMLKKVVAEGWAIFKGPAAYLLAGAIAYFVYHEFAIPVAPTPTPVSAPAAPAEP